jgi:anti-sigma regulatory factor (Ser/Thr protein kinase)
MKSVPAQAPEVPTLVLDPSGEAPGLARRFLAGLFREWGVEDDHAGRVVVSELVTNAYQHGRGAIVVRVYRDQRDGEAVIEVWDEGPGLPVLGTAGGNATSGRGLMLMSRLVQDWGTRPAEGGGKIVWGRVSL